LITSAIPILSTTASASPSGILYQVPVYINNTQSVATGSFQQMVKIPISAFSNYIYDNNTTANFEFYYANNTIIPAWIESVNSTTIVVWLKLYSIPASTKITIYLGFASKSTNLLSSSGTTGIGEAPQLSPTYGQYDNGARVFNNYWNFAGTSLPSGLTALGNVIVNNSLTITPTTSSNSAVYTNYTINSNSNILEAYMKQSYYGGLFYSISYTGRPYTSSGWIAHGSGAGESYNGVFSPNPNNEIVTVVNGSVYTNGISYSYPSGYAVYGVINVGNLAEDTVNYSILATAPTANSPNGQNYYAEILSVSSKPPALIYVQWLRTRAYPPNGVMPVVNRYYCCLRNLL
jgi:hypothetical protein